MAPSRLSTCSTAEDILILSDKGGVFLYKTTTCCGYIVCYHTGRNVTHLLLSRRRVDGEKKRKRRFSNKYHDVHPTSYSACPIRDAIVLGLSFGQAKNDPLHYLWTHFFYSCREKIYVFKNIRMRVDESLAGMRKYTIPSDLM